VIPRAPGSLGLLALALFYRWQPKRLFVILTCYIDESGTHGGSPVTIMAGYVGRLGRWKSFDPKWNRFLEQNEVRPFFHSKEFKANKPPYRGWPQSKKYKFITRAAKIVSRHASFGFSICLKNDEYRSIYRHGPPLRSHIDSEYATCFRYCLSTIPHIAREAEGGNDIDLFFVLEDSQHFGEAREVFQQIKRRDPELAKMLRDCVPGAKADYPALQAADVGAFNTFHYEQDDPSLESVAHDGTFEGARKISEGCPIFRYIVQREVLEEMRDWAERAHAKNTAKAKRASE
jgi:hypothetical protein